MSQYYKLNSMFKIEKEVINSTESFKGGRIEKMVSKLGLCRRPKNCLEDKRLEQITQRRRKSWTKVWKCKYLWWGIENPSSLKSLKYQVLGGRKQEVGNKGFLTPGNYQYVLHFYNLVISRVLHKQKHTVYNLFKNLHLFFYF